MGCSFLSDSIADRIVGIVVDIVGGIAVGIAEDRGMFVVDIEETVAVGIADNFAVDIVQGIVGEIADIVWNIVVVKVAYPFESKADKIRNRVEKYWK